MPSLDNKSSKLAKIHKLKFTPLILGQINFSRQSLNLRTEKYLGFGISPEYEGEFKKLCGQRVVTKYYRVYCCKFYWYKDRADLKAQGSVDILSATSRVEDDDDKDVLRIFPRHDGKDLRILVDELGMSIKTYIVEMKAWEATNSLIDEGRIDQKHRASALYVSPVSYELVYSDSKLSILGQPSCLDYVSSIMFDTLIDISLVNVTIHEGMFEVIETTVIKCLSLRYLTLSNNNM